jgi:protein-disulfide isomerase
LKDVKVEVVGPDPPCQRCQALKKDVEKAAAKLKDSGFNIEITKLNMVSKEVIGKYGILVSPALVVNGVVKSMGRLPSADEIKRIIEKA